MKTYEEAVEEAVRIWLSREYSDVISAFRAAAGRLISLIYDKSLGQVHNDMYELHNRLETEAIASRKKAAKLEAQASNEQRRLANIARKLAETKE